MLSPCVRATRKIHSERVLHVRQTQQNTNTHTKRKRTTMSDGNEQNKKNLTKKRKKSERNSVVWKGNAHLKINIPSSRSFADSNTLRQSASQAEAETQTQARKRMNSDRMLTVAEAHNRYTFTNWKFSTVHQHSTWASLTTQGRAGVSEKATSTVVPVVLCAELILLLPNEKCHRPSENVSLSLALRVRNCFSFLRWLFLNMYESY